MVNLEAVTDVSDARDRLEAFINYSGELATYDAVDQVLYEQCNVPGAAAFLIEHFGGEPVAERVAGTQTVFTKSAGVSVFEASIRRMSDANDVFMTEDSARMLRKPKTLRYATLTLDASSDRNAVFDRHMGHVLANKFSPSSLEDFRTAIASKKRDALEEDAIAAAATKSLEETIVDERSEMAIYVKTIQSLTGRLVEVTKK